MTVIGISRGIPRNHSGARRLRELEPGPWFKSVGTINILDRHGRSAHRHDDLVVLTESIHRSEQAACELGWPPTRGGQK